MGENIVSKPPLQAPVVDANNLMTRAWASWFRDLYVRTSFKGGNAIDNNKDEVDEELLGINSTLNETIVQTNENTQGVASNKQNLEAHVQEEVAHESNGKIVGFDDTANETKFGIVKRMAVIADAEESSVEITTPDIATAPVAYDQAYIQTIADLTNENKAAINQLAIDLNNAIGVLNNLLAKSKTSGQMTIP